MRSIPRVAALAVATVALVSTPAAAQDPPDYTPGAPGIGDPYFPLDGNGGYDVEDYELRISYDPETDHLDGQAQLSVRATQDLSAFNLDLEGLTVRSVKVDGRTAGFAHDEPELTVTPPRGLRNGQRFKVTVVYDGVPDVHTDPELGSAGWFNTDDGSLVVGEPDVAATWFPVNDHPLDKASYTVRITVPEGLEAVSNGRLLLDWSRNGWHTWYWRQPEPMASYLATATIGEFDVDTYTVDGLPYWDYVDVDLHQPSAVPASGERFARSQTADSSYKRLTRTVEVPAEGATLSFLADRNTEDFWDFFFVEARTAGGDDWTTLPDANGHTSTSVGASCPYWLDIHPFLTHYQTPVTSPGSPHPDTCDPSGTSGDWHAVSGDSGDYEEWEVDLSAWAGSTAEVSLTYASDDIIQNGEVVIDDVEVSTGEGSTSFEDDGDPLDGWAASGAPEGSPGNQNDWVTGGADDLPRIGDTIDAVFARQPEVLAYLSDTFGPYPFSAGGGIVDDAPLGFALENQTRPIYSTGFFGSEASGMNVVVHELAHQWYGDSVAVAAWQHIWLNEGFASYAEWLWAEHQGTATAQETFDAYYGFYSTIPEFWQLPIGDPGPTSLFAGAVYDRGAMTLHALRVAVGDEAFFQILPAWASTKEGGNGTTDEFIALAEDISGQELGDLFDVWLFGSTPPDPVGGAPAVAARSAAEAQVAAGTAPATGPAGADESGAAMVARAEATARWAAEHGVTVGN